MKAARICGCGHRIASGMRCQCEVQRKAAAEQRRPSAHARGYTSKWTKESKAWLAQPGREWCACGCGRRADMVDHKVAHKGDQRLFWDRSNWQPMNGGCNSRKAARSEGGFGRTPGRGASQTLAKGSGTAWGQSRDIFPNFSSREKGQNG
jgi:5-methylcytosine-specific restriction protein A